MKILILTFAFVSFEVVLSDKVTVHPCDYRPDGPPPKWVKISGCRGDTCVMKTGQAYKVEAHFKSNQNTTKLNFDVYARIAGIDIMIPDVEHDGCLNIEPACPLVKGQYYTHTLTHALWPILPHLKGLRMTVKAQGYEGPLSCGYVMVDID